VLHIDIESQDSGRGPTVRNRPDSGSSELLDDVTTSEDRACEVEHVFVVPNPSRSVPVRSSANSG
jgi:hypothetical protein